MTADATSSGPPFNYVAAMRPSRRLIVPKDIRDQLDGRFLVTLRKLPGAMPSADDARAFHTFVTMLANDPRIVVPEDIARDADLDLNDRAEVYIKPFDPRTLAATDRVTLRDGDDFVDVAIDGVVSNTVAVDFYTGRPRLLVHADGREEPTHVIDLPLEDES